VSNPDNRLDQTNRATWSSEMVLGLFAAREGTFDLGEAAVLERLADSAAGVPILDIGVGGGRTIPHLRRLSTDYVGIDYLEEMVALARSRFPGVRIEHADARDLSRFPDAAFGLVFFSANGIDGVSHDDRSRMLAEIRRVLRPDGLFAYATHNLEHEIAGRTPWHPAWYREPPRRALARAFRLPKSLRAYRRARPLTVRGDGWATLVDPAYHFGIVTHFVTLEAALRELRTADFAADPEIYDRWGNGLRPGSDTRGTFWFYLVARRP